MHDIYRRRVADDLHNQLGSRHFEGVIMKTWMKVVLGIVAGISVLVGVIFWLTGDVTKAGDEFFAAVQNDDMDAAYALLSDDFKAGTSKEELKAYLAANALDKIKEASWGGRMMTGGVAELEGTITTAGGSKIPLKLRLIDSDSGWQINAIEKESAGFKGGGTDAISPPPSAKQQQLFRDTVAVFAASLTEKNMKKLLDIGSSNYREEVSVERLDQAFGPFFPYAEGYLDLGKYKPIIDNAEIDETTEILILQGHYPVKPIPVYFRQLFIYEGIDWKLHGLAVKTGSPPE